MRKSKILAKLRAEKPVCLVAVNLGPSPLAVEIAGRAGIDGVWIDTEHRPRTQREVAEMINAARVADTDTVVRIRKGEGYTSFFRPLEDGATAIMVPHVKSPEEAEWVVRNAKYPPIGRRGSETVMCDADLGFSEPLAYMAHANQETFVVVQIEDAEALDDVDGIASLAGIDILFVGPADLSISLGVPFQWEHPAYQEAVHAVARAAEQNGKHWGLPVASLESAARHAEDGARFFTRGSDLGYFKAACVRLREEFDQIFGV